MKKLLPLLLLLLAACGSDVQQEYTSYVARLVYNPAETPLPPLQAAITSQNTFCTLTLTQQTAATYTLAAALPQQDQQTVRVALAHNPTPVLGLANDKGLIIGNSSLQTDNPYVFDRVCPNCYADHRDPRYALTLTTALTALCPNCHRTYALLNQGAIAAGSPGQKLIRYRAQATPDGTLRIINQ